MADAASDLQRSPNKPYKAENREDAAKANICAQVGSSGDLDLVDEHLMLHEQTLAIGFVGKPLEIPWLRKLHTDGGNDKNDGWYGPPGQDGKSAAERLVALRHYQRANLVPLMHTSKANYYLNGQPLEIEFRADSMGMPSFPDRRETCQGIRGELSSFISISCEESPRGEILSL